MTSLALRAAAAPASLLTGPPRLPNPYGIFSVVSFTETPLDSPARWTNGAEWETLGCGPLPDVLVVDCTDAPGPEKNFEQNTGYGGADPFTVYATWACSPVGFTALDAETRAVDRLVANEERAVGLAAWAQLLADPEHQDFGEFPSPGAALVAVEQANRASYGSLGVLFVTVPALPLMEAYLDAAYDAAIGIEVLHDPYGTPAVVVDASETMIGITPAVDGYRTAVFNPDPAGVFDRRSNDLIGLAERTYLLGWDPCGTYTASISASAFTAASASIGGTP